LDKENAEAWLDLAETRLESGLIGEALEAYGQVLRLKPAASEVHLRRAQVLASVGQRESAERALDRACELEPIRSEEFRSAYGEVWGVARSGGHQGGGKQY